MCVNFMVGKLHGHVACGSVNEMHIKHLSYQTPRHRFKDAPIKYIIAERYTRKHQQLMLCNNVCTICLFNANITYKHTHSYQPGRTELITCGFAKTLPTRSTRINFNYFRLLTPPLRRHRRRRRVIQLLSDFEEQQMPCALWI